MQIPINTQLRRDELADEIKRKELYENLINEDSSRAHREKIAAAIGISEANYSIPNGTPFGPYFKIIGLPLYRYKNTYYNLYYC